MNNLDAIPWHATFIQSLFPLSRPFVANGRPGLGANCALPGHGGRDER
jgi:hypothetical protein